MKNIGLLFIALVGFVLMSSQTSTKAKTPHIEFETTIHDYGNITVGDNGNFSFKFKNSGKEPLIIQGVRSSCGCTVAKKPNAPIMPGESDMITVRYDTRRIGTFRKTITVTSNADNATIVLTIKGNVHPKPQEAAPVKEEQEGFTPVNR
jgi:hypothetical protein